MLVFCSDTLPAARQATAGGALSYITDKATSSLLPAIKEIQE